MGDLSVLEAVGIVAGVIAIVLSGMWVMLKLAFNIGINNKILKDLVDRFDKLPCAERKEEINEVKANVVEIKADIVGVKADIVGIKVEIAGIHLILSSINSTLSTIGRWIMKQDSTMIDPLSADSSLINKNSPKALSELGHEIIGIIDGMKFLENYKDFFLDLIDKENPKTALDVETSAHYVCISSINNDIFIPMKNVIYHAPAIQARNKNGEQVSFNIDIFNACSVLSIPLRDMYLLEHSSLLDPQ